MSINAESLELIKRWEGLRLKAYKDTGGVWTIGYGHTSDAALQVRPGLSITEEKAEEILLIDVTEAEAIIDKYVKVPLNEYQRGALTAFVLNIGEGQFRSSTLLKKLNAGLYDEVPGQLRRWVYDNGKKIEGLVNRRNAEIGLWTREAFVSSKTAPAATKPVKQVAISPEGVATVAAPVFGGLATFSKDSDILQYGLVFMMITASLVGAYYIIKRINKE